MKKKKYCNLGKLISIKLIELGQNQKWLAEQSHTSGERISAYITGKAIPSTKKIYVLSQTLGINSGELIEAIISEENQTL